MTEKDVIEAAARKRSRWTPGESCVAAEIRALPPPFHFYLTITSDCDGPRLERFLAVGETFRRRFGLPIADSLFPGWLRKQALEPAPVGTPTPAAAPTWSRRRLLERAGPLLTRCHEGWFDVIHGWIQRFTIKIADDFTLRSRWWRPVVKHRARFTAPPDWQQVEPPRYLVMQYALPVSRSTFTLVGRVGRRKVFELSSRTFDPEHRFLPQPVMVDLHPLMGTDPDELLRLQVDFTLKGTPGSILVVKDLCLTSDGRATVREEKDLLEAFNIHIKTFTSHGVGVVMGVQQCASPRSVDARWCADWPGNTYYIKDILDAYGLRFFSTYSNTCQTDLKPLREEVKPVVFYDGRPGYDFFRYAHYPRNPNGGYNLDVFRHDGKPTDPSHADYIGFHLRAAMEQMDAFGEGGLLYTHAGVRNPVILEAERPPDLRPASPHMADPTSRQALFAVLDDLDESRLWDTINADTEQALQALADRYLNLTGRTPDTRRIWVAPTGVLLRQARLLRGADGNVWYDPRENAVHVRTWFDPLTREPLPNPRYGVQDISGLTVYVESSETARLFVDGEPVSHVIRNTADHTGRESLTLADVASPRPLVDSVDLRTKGGDLDETDAQYRHETGEAFCGTGCAQLETTAPRGGVAWNLPEPMPLEGCDAVRFAYRKSAPKTRVRATFDLADAEPLVVEEDGFSRDPARTRIPFRETTAWVDVVVPFALLLEALEPERRFAPGCKALARLRLEVSGEAGTVVWFDVVELLRANANPPSADGHLVVGGWVLGPVSAWREVRLRCAGAEQVTEPVQNGCFFFEEKVPIGEVIAVWGVDASGRCHDPVFGRYREMRTNVADVHFRPPDTAAARPDGAGSGASS